MSDSGSAHEAAALLNLAQQVGKAWGARDVATLARLIDDHYFHTDVTGRTLSRAEWLADVPRTAQLPTITFDDTKVTIFGDVAVITGRNGVTMAAEGKAVDRALGGVKQ